MPKRKTEDLSEVPTKQPISFSCTYLPSLPGVGFDSREEALKKQNPCGLFMSVDHTEMLRLPSAPTAQNECLTISQTEDATQAKPSVLQSRESTVSKRGRIVGKEHRKEVNRLAAVQFRGRQKGMIGKLSDGFTHVADTIKNLEKVVAAFDMRITGLDMRVASMASTLSNTILAIDNLKLASVEVFKKTNVEAEATNKDVRITLLEEENNSLKSGIAIKELENISLKKENRSLKEYYNNYLGDLIALSSRVEKNISEFPGSFFASEVNTELPSSIEVSESSADFPHRVSDINSLG